MKCSECPVYNPGTNDYRLCRGTTGDGEHHCVCGESLINSSYARASGKEKS